MSDFTSIFLCLAAIRKMTIERKTIEGGMHRRDIVSDYSDYASQVYAPLARIGVFLDRGSEQYVVKSRYLSSYQGTHDYIITLTLSNVFPPACQGLIYFCVHSRRSNNCSVSSYLWVKDLRNTGLIIYKHICCLLIDI